MLDTNHNHSSCGYAEQMISHLYGEANQAEDAQLEAHLKTCFTCADELANFGIVRSSVLEWRREEFFKLEVPTFEIPCPENSSQANLTASSWFDGLRRAFSFSPVWAAGLAALLVFGGLAFFAMNFSKNAEVAGTNKIVKPIIASPTVEKTIGKLIGNPNGDNSEKAKPDESLKPTVASSKDSQTETANQKQVAPRSAPIKISDNTLTNNTTTVETVRNVKDLNKENKKLPSAQKPKVPSLTIVEEDEDTTVRLADLFDELDTK